MKALFIHGPQGSGKTFMANAIALLANSESNGEEIIYFPAKKRARAIDLLNAGVVIVEDCETDEDVNEMYFNINKITIDYKLDPVRLIFTSQKDFDLPPNRFNKIKAAHQ